MKIILMFAMVVAMHQLAFSEITNGVAGTNSPVAVNSKTNKAKVAAPTVQTGLPSDVTMQISQLQVRVRDLQQQIITAERWDYQIRDYHHLPPMKKPLIR